MAIHTYSVAELDRPLVELMIELKQSSGQWASDVPTPFEKKVPTRQIPLRRDIHNRLKKGRELTAKQQEWLLGQTEGTSNLFRLVALHIVGDPEVLNKVHDKMLWDLDKKTADALFTYAFYLNDSQSVEGESAPDFSDPRIQSLVNEVFSPAMLISGPELLLAYQYTDRNSYCSIIGEGKIDWDRVQKLISSSPFDASEVRLSLPHVVSHPHSFYGNLFAANPELVLQRVCTSFASLDEYNQLPAIYTALEESPCITDEIILWTIDALAAGWYAPDLTILAHHVANNLDDDRRDFYLNAIGNSLERKLATLKRERKLEGQNLEHKLRYFAGLHTSFEGLIAKCPSASKLLPKIDLEYWVNWARKRGLTLQDEKDVVGFRFMRTRQRSEETLDADVMANIIQSHIESLNSKLGLISKSNGGQIPLSRELRNEIDNLGYFVDAVEAGHVEKTPTVARLVDSINMSGILEAAKGVEVGEPLAFSPQTSPQFRFNATEAR